MIRLGVLFITGYIVGIAQEITMNKRAKSNSIRIIAGQWRGRRLPVLDSHGLRPTTDRVRETLFNWLMHDVPGAHCLDLFAGTGALGFECLSRGAASVQFVEADRRVAEQVQSNINLLDARESAQVTNTSAAAFLTRPPSRPMDLVFLDPPFSAELLPEVIKLLTTNNWLADNAMVYVEQSSSDLPLTVDWNLHRSGRAGQSAYCLYAV